MQRCLSHVFSDRVFKLGRLILSPGGEIPCWSCNSFSSWNLISFSALRGHVHCSVICPLQQLETFFMPHGALCSLPTSCLQWGLFSWLPVYQHLIFFYYFFLSQHSMPPGMFPGPTPYCISPFPLVLFITCHVGTGKTLAYHLVYDKHEIVLYEKSCF